MSRVAVIMGSATDYDTLRAGIAVLDELQIEREVRIISAHRTPDEMAKFARTARERGLSVIIAAAGGAAHLPGMVAAHTTLPVIGVPVPATVLQGVDSLLSICQMPRGTPVATMAIGAPGAVNAAWLAAQILSLANPRLVERLEEHRAAVRDQVLATELSP
jgi:5-(carboxyamino)imidazole ribonucleotide mutase